MVKSYFNNFGRSLDLPEVQDVAWPCLVPLTPSQSEPLIRDRANFITPSFGCF